MKHHCHGLNWSWAVCSVNTHMWTCALPVNGDISANQLQHQELNHKRLWIYVCSLCYLCVIPLLSGSYDLVPIDLLLFLSCSSAISQLQDNKHLFYSIMRFQSKERQKKKQNLGLSKTLTEKMVSFSLWAFPVCFYLNGPAGACAEPWTWIRTCRSSTGSCVRATAVAGLSSPGGCPHPPPPSLPPLSALHWWVHNRKPRRVMHRRLEAAQLVRANRRRWRWILKMWPDRQARAFDV